MRVTMTSPLSFRVRSKSTILRRHNGPNGIVRRRRRRRGVEIAVHKKFHESGNLCCCFWKRTQFCARWASSRPTPWAPRQGRLPSAPSNNSRTSGPASGQAEPATGREGDPWRWDFRRPSPRVCQAHFPSREIWKWFYSRLVTFDIEYRKHTLSNSKGSSPLWLLTSNKIHEFGLLKHILFKVRYPHLNNCKMQSETLATRDYIKE